MDEAELNSSVRIDGFDPYRAVAHFDVNTIEIDDVGYRVSSGRDCQALTSSMTASVTEEMRVGEASVPYISSRWL